MLGGRDRVVAALEKGGAPSCVVLVRVLDAVEVMECQWRAGGGELGERSGLDARLADALAALPYDEARTRSWPLPGGASAWDREAGRAVFQFPGD